MNIRSSALPETETDDGAAARFAQELLDRFGLPATVVALADHPALAWRRAGLFDLTGRRDGGARVSPVAVTTVADGALLALQTLAPQANLPSNGPVLLGERARLMGLSRQGQISANGSARLISTANGHVALNLPRPEDWASLPALFGAAADDWAAVERLASGHLTDALVTQGRLLGLAIAPEADGLTAAPFAFRPANRVTRDRPSSPLVIDLSALWAGPLAASLLGMAGARVVKVESLRRPDGARGGHGGFYDLLNADKSSVALDFEDAGDLRRLRALIDAADIVVESTRPRALEQLGIHAQDVAGRGATWLSLTAYGRQGDAASWVGFGDDAAVAGGLSAAMRRAWGGSVFGGDAIADPLAGIMGAFAAWASWLSGGGLVSVALADVVACACALGETRGPLLERWQALAIKDGDELYPLRQVAKAARPLGADTAEILASL